MIIIPEMKIQDKQIFFHSFFDTLFQEVRKRERERETDRQKERQRKKETHRNDIISGNFPCKVYQTYIVLLNFGF
jgi:hypothetical protein